MQLTKNLPVWVVGRRAGTPVTYPAQIVRVEDDSATLNDGSIVDLTREGDRVLVDGKIDRTQEGFVVTNADTELFARIYSSQEAYDKLMKDYPQVAEILKKGREADRQKTRDERKRSTFKALTVDSRVFVVMTNDIVGKNGVYRKVVEVTETQAKLEDESVILLSEDGLPTTVNGRIFMSREGLPVLRDGAKVATAFTSAIAFKLVTGEQDKLRKSPEFAKFTERRVREAANRRQRSAT